MKIYFAILSALILQNSQVSSNTLRVGANKYYHSIRKAIQDANTGDTILVFPGLYKEQNLVIDKPLVLIGINFPI